MKRFFPYCFTLLLALGLITQTEARVNKAEVLEISQVVEPADTDTLILSDPVALFESLPTPVINHDVIDWSLIPKVFSGYQEIPEIPANPSKKLKYKLATMYPPVEIDDMMFRNDTLIFVDSISHLFPPVDTMPVVDNVLVIDSVPMREAMITETTEVIDTVNSNLPDILAYKTPQWLRDAVKTSQFQENILYSYMIDNPMAIEYAYWDLPLPPVLLEEDRSFMGFLRRQRVPKIDPAEAVLPEIELGKKHWLHTVNSVLQFSQAYVSPNWYQGGNSYLSMLFGFNWNVNLNQVYHPKLLFQSAFQYKVAFSSNPKGYYHRYTIAEDNFQYNLNAGLKAAKEWYYSFNLQFKTQLFNNFEENSSVRTAAFLSPADLNMGLGMSYNHSNKLGTFKFTLTVSPLSYNLKACLKPNNIIDHATYGIAADKHTKSEIGSNLDFNMDWKMTANISYKTRVFMFTDYHYYLADWQNTFNFDINKFLSTQLFVHLRYDGSTENFGRWKKFMLREILSFGLSYTFSTKP